MSDNEWNRPRVPDFYPSGSFSGRDDAATRRLADAIRTAGAKGTAAELAAFDAEPYIKTFPAWYQHRLRESVYLEGLAMTIVHIRAGPDADQPIVSVLERIERESRNARKPGSPGPAVRLGLTPGEIIATARELGGEPTQEAVAEQLGVTERWLRVRASMPWADVLAAAKREPEQSD